MNYRALAPNGRPIVASLEKLLAEAEITHFYMGDNGSMVPEYEGTTNISWDTQEAVTEDGFCLYLDDQGNTWPYSVLSFHQQEEAP